MELIKETDIKIGEKIISSTVFKLEDSDELENISRVYVIATDSEKNIPLIYNSKRKIWGLPGGHTEPNETIEETAFREVVEEIKKSTKNCEKKFLIVNKIDYENEEKQVICFAEIDKNNDEIKDTNESVKKVVYTSINDITSKIGNEELWTPIIKEFKNWITQK